MSDEVAKTFADGWEWERHALVPAGPPAPSPPLAQRLGFRLDAIEYADADRAVHRYHASACPLWAPTSLLAALPATRVYRRLRRRPPGCWQSSGYDLRATPVRCPECGHEPTV